MAIEVYKGNPYNSPDEAIIGIEAEENEAKPAKSDAEIITAYKKHKADAEAYWGEIHQEMERDWDIYLLDQWTSEMSLKRGRRPKMTVDICRKFVKKIIRWAYETPPAGSVNSVSAVSKDKASRLGEAIRFFEDKGGLKQSASYAVECASVGGLGFMRMSYKYDESNPLPATLCYERINDPFSIMMDPDSCELDGADQNFAIEYHAKKNGKDRCTYWWRDDENRVYWAVIHDEKIEDQGEFPDFRVPIVPVYGEVYRMRGKTKIFGIVRPLRDIQGAYNFSMSEGIERLAITPKAPIEAEIGSIPAQYRKPWIDSITDPVPIVEFTAYDTKTGRALAPPRRSNTTPDVSWLPPLLATLQENAKETTGIYDTSLGNNGQEISGKAIELKTENSDAGMLIYQEHLNISVSACTGIALRLLKPIVEPSGVLPTLTNEGAIEIIKIGQNPMMPQDPNAITDLDASDLDISVSTKPAFVTRKKEVVAHVMEMIKISTPEQAQKLMPQLLRDMDFPSAERYAEILDPTQENPAQSLSMMQEQMMAMQAELEQTKQALQGESMRSAQLELRLQNNTEASIAKAQIDANTSLIITDKNNAAKLQESAMNNASREAIAGAKITTDQAKMTSDFMLEQDKLTQKATADAEKNALESAKFRADLIEKAVENAQNFTIPM